VATPELQRRFEELLARDARYPEQAYALIQQAARRAHAEQPQPDGSLRHVTARALLEALRDDAIGAWGGDARDCLAALGIKTSDDVGEIVYNLVGIGRMATTEGDSRAQFTGTFDFEKEFPNSRHPAWVTVWGVALVISLLLVLAFVARHLAQALTR
jgi:uncharacterized repeat protein (TIGR04138 family)